MTGGYLAGFVSEAEQRSALERVRAAGVDDVEAFMPMPPEDLAKGSPLPVIMFVAGVLGFGVFFWLMAYANTRAYPLDIGGRPAFAWPAYVPIAFELGALCAMTAGFVGYFIACRLPRLYEPVDAYLSFRDVSRDAWFITVRSGDAAALERARIALEDLATLSLEELA